MSEMTDEEAAEAFEGISGTFNVLMGAKVGRLEPPVTITPAFTGDKAHALGSARHIAEMVEDEGYTAEVEYIGETKPITEGDERHETRITVTED